MPHHQTRRVIETLYPVEPDGPVTYTPPAWASGDLDGFASPRRTRRLRSPDEPGRTLPLCFPPLDREPIRPMADPDEHHLWRAMAWGAALSLPWYIAVGIAAAILRAKGLL
jgi:hypothetical protein